MSTTQADLNGIASFARLTAAILLALMVGTGYAVSPRVEGAVDASIEVVERDTAEAPDLTPECVADGLVFASCNLDGQEL